MEVEKGLGEIVKDLFRSSSIPKNAWKQLLYIGFAYFKESFS